MKKDKIMGFCFWIFLDHTKVIPPTTTTTTTTRVTSRPAGLRPQVKKGADFTPGPSICRLRSLVRRLWWWQRYGGGEKLWMAGGRERGGGTFSSKEIGERESGEEGEISNLRGKEEEEANFCGPPSLQPRAPPPPSRQRRFPHLS